MNFWKLELGRADVSANLHTVPCLGIKTLTISNSYLKGSKHVLTTVIRLPINPQLSRA